MYKAKIYDLVFVHWKSSLKGLAFASGIILTALHENHLGPSQYVACALSVCGAVTGLLSYDVQPAKQ